MAISRLQASLAQATNEVTVAAASINFDFCLVKYEAPKEYRPIGKLLSIKRKQDAEHGASHATARRLTALFDGICPNTPNLITAYGNRVSEISQQATDRESQEHSKSIFGLYTGVDATSIWAAATSSQGSMAGAIHVHLLACMLSTMFDAAEATSIWVELVEERRKAIAQSLERDEEVSFASAAAAAQQEITRSQLADWDASARAWLQTADSIMRTKQTQLRLILENISMSMGSETKVLPSVVDKWVQTLNTMERLIKGIPQEVQDGSAIIGLAAWHIYPNIEVFGSRNVQVPMNDSLVSPGGVLTLGCSPSATSHRSGVSWSLSLDQYKYYGPSVRREGRFKPDPTKLTFDELMLATLGSVLLRWNVPTNRTATINALEFIEMLSEKASDISKVELQPKSFVLKVEGLRLLSEAATEWFKNESASSRFTNLGRNRADFIPLSLRSSREMEVNVRPFFGLTNKEKLLHCIRDGDGCVELLRRIAGRTPELMQYPCIIQYVERKETGQRVLCYATVFPSSRSDDDECEGSSRKHPTNRHARWLQPNSYESATTKDAIYHNINGSTYYQDKMDRIVWHNSNDRGRIRMEVWFGVWDKAAICVAPDTPAIPQPIPKITEADLMWCLEHDFLAAEEVLTFDDSVSRTLEYLAMAYDEAFETIKGPVIQVQTLERPLLKAGCLTNVVNANQVQQVKISILAYFVAGHDMQHARIPDNIVGISVGDSIFVPSRLLHDPLVSNNSQSLIRILGNIGKPGFVMFFSVQNPMMAQPDPACWRDMNPQQFDGAGLNLFHNTSMHLSFTNWERPIENYAYTGDRDVLTFLMESVISIREKGVWIGDVDVMAALKSPHIYRLPEQEPCDHPQPTKSDFDMTSIESWDELREFRSGNLVVRANKNWLARLATTAYVAQCFVVAVFNSICAPPITAMVREEHPYRSILSTIGLGGTQVVFSLFAGQAVIHLKAFGLNPFEIAVTLLFGPLCGAIFPPLFGAWSDQCQSSWGRRRPFIFWGTVVMVLSILSLAWADSITMAVVPPTTAPTTVRTVLVSLSMILTLAVFVAVQAVQVSLRASITDGSTPMQQSKANTWAGRHVTISGFLAYFAAFIGSSQDSAGINSTVFTRTSIITAVYLAITILVTCLCTTDQQAATFETLRIRRVANFRLMRRILLESSGQIRTIYLVQFFSWLGWFPLLFYTVPYVNSLDRADETANTSSGALAPLSYSAVSLLMAFLWTSQSSKDGSVFKFSNTLSITDRDIWIGSHCIFGWSMLGTFFVTSALGTVLLFSAIGISWAVTARVPYSLLGQELSRGSTHLGEEDVSDHQGLIYGLHNLAICLPQILMMALMGLVWLFTQTSDGIVGVVWFLRLGGLSAFAAAYFATRLDEKPSGIVYDEIEHLEVDDSV